MDCVAQGEVSARKRVRQAADTTAEADRMNKTEPPGAEGNPPGTGIPHRETARFLFPLNSIDIQCLARCLYGVCSERVPSLLRMRTERAPYKSAAHSAGGWPTPAVRTAGRCRAMRACSRRGGRRAENGDFLPSAAVFSRHREVICKLFLIFGNNLPPCPQGVPRNI